MVAEQNVEQEPEGSAPEAEEKHANGVSTGNRGVWLALMLVVGGGGFGAWQYLYLPLQQLRSSLLDSQRAWHDAVRVSQDRLGSVEERVEELAGQVKSMDTRFGAWTQEAQAARQVLQQSVRSLRREQGRQRVDWLVFEAEHLLVTASQVLHLNRDPKTAKAALQYADEALRNTEDPVWLTVRRQLAGEMDSLDRIRVPDRAGIAFRIRAFGESVERLPLVPVPAPVAQAQPESYGSTWWDKTRDWRKQLGELVRTLVIVERVRAPGPALLEPRQHQYLVENLKLLMRIAEVALERADQESYERHLNQARSWIERYYDPDLAEVAAALQTLDELRREKIRMELPDLSGSLRQLREVLRGRPESAE